MKVRIAVDSTADMPEALKARVSVVPLNVHFGEESYIDGVTISHQEFYQKLESSKDLPKTSAPSPEAFMKVYEAAKEAGEELVMLTISSGLSATYQSAMIAAQDYENVYVVDSLHVANGLGVLAAYALDLADQGMSAQEIAERVTAERENIEFSALLDTLEYLKRGGRISKTVAFAGGLLNLKPIIGINGGLLNMKGKARGWKQGSAQLLKEMQTVGVDFDKPYLVGYSGMSDERMQKFLADSAAFWNEGGKPVQTVPLCSVISTHAGPGAVIVAYFKKNK